MNYKMVGRVLGMVLLCLTGLMLVPLLAGIIYGENVRPFVLCIALSLALGLGLASIKPDSTASLRSALRGCSCRSSARCPIS